jgi:hypothetical protein
MLSERATRLLAALRPRASAPPHASDLDGDASAAAAGASVLLIHPSARAPPRARTHGHTRALQRTRR